MSDLLLEQIKKELNSNKIYFNVDYYFEYPLENKIYVSFKSQVKYDSFIIYGYNINRHGSSHFKSSIEYSYIITSDNFNIYNFIKIFEINVNNTNIKTLISWISDLNTCSNKFNKCVENLPLEFL